jgi:hypothetical protein
MLELIRRSTLNLLRYDLLLLFRDGCAVLGGLVGVLKLASEKRDGNEDWPYSISGSS